MPETLIADNVEELETQAILANLHQEVPDSGFVLLRTELCK